MRFRRHVRIRRTSSRCASSWIRLGLGSSLLRAGWFVAKECWRCGTGLPPRVCVSSATALSASDCTKPSRTATPRRWGVSDSSFALKALSGVSSGAIGSAFACPTDLVKRNQLLDEGFPLHLSASMVAGLACSVTSAPFDTVKVRLMQDKKREFKNAFDCLAKLVANEGPLALYKGSSNASARCSASNRCKSTHTLYPHAQPIEIVHSSQIALGHRIRNHRGQAAGKRGKRVTKRRDTRAAQASNKTDEHIVHAQVALHHLWAAWWGRPRTGDRWRGRDRVGHAVAAAVHSPAVDAAGVGLGRDTAAAVVARAVAGTSAGWAADLRLVLASYRPPD
ncbi:hypothetical protein L1887_48442 [Cichorium endivia]|nr:hypothetical protein L1887_48442 [Cichorium endivia]